MLVKLKLVSRILYGIEVILKNALFSSRLLNFPRNLEGPRVHNTGKVLSRESFLLELQIAMLPIHLHVVHTTFLLLKVIFIA
jgi:hypothetical protein